MADRTSTVRVNVVTDASGAGATLGKFGKVAGVAALGVGALAVGTAYGATKLYAYGDATDDANAKIANVVKTMKLFKGQTEEVTQRVQDQAKAVSLATAVDINSIKATQAKLLSFKEIAKTADEMGGVFDRTTKAAIDMAALGFGEAESNAVQLGKALNDPIKGITALTRSGITFTEAEKAKIAVLVESNKMGEAQAFVLKAIETQVKGTAEATAGGFELMQNRVSIFAQELATKALPYLDRFGTFMIETGGPALLRFGRNLQEEVTPALQRLGTFIQERVLPALVSLSGWVNEHVIPAYKDALPEALEGARGMFKNVADAVKDNEGDLRELGKALKTVAEFLFDKVIPVMGDFYKNVLPAVGTAIGAAIGVIADITAGFKHMYDQAQDVVGAIQAVIDKIQSIPTPDINIPGVGRVAAGAGGGGGAGQQPFTHQPVQVRVEGFIGDEVTLARELKRILNADTRRYGPV